MYQAIDIINRLGFDVTIEHAGDFHGAMFCKIVFSHTPTGIVAYKRVDHALAKLGWYEKPLNDRKAKDIMRAKLCSFVAMYEGWDKAVELATAIDQDYMRCVKRVADFYTAPVMVATSHYMTSKYGALMDHIIKQVKK